MGQENKTLKSFAFIFLIDLLDIKRVGSQLSLSGVA